MRVSRKYYIATALLLFGLSLATYVIMLQRINADEVQIIAVGDMVCDPSKTASESVCKSEAVLEAIRTQQPDALLLLGDLQYDKGTAENFRKAFDVQIGSLKGIAYPAVGNHEYGQERAKGYFDYWNGQQTTGRAGETGKGYYDVNIGGWDLYALNTNCEHVTGGCGDEGEQADWFRDSLSKNTARCSIAFWHHPRVSSGKHGKEQASKDRSKVFWKLFEENGGDIVLAGHDHLYERYDPQDVDGNKSETGIRQFVVGTGGKDLYPKELDPMNRAFVQDQAYGYLKLLLKKNSYKWEFVSVEGKVLDSGAAECGKNARATMQVWKKSFGLMTSQKPLAILSAFLK